MMTVGQSWWRRLGGALAACLVALLILAPLADSFVCLGDEATTSTQTFAALEPVASQSPVDTDHQRGDPGLCTHGHCHHGASFVMASIGPAGAVAPLTSVLAPRHAAALVSITAQRLDDPPRA